jgi:CRISPR-associated protein Cmr4
MKTRPFLIHALSPLHAGTGQSVDVIDLPIARMRSTGIPIVPGSSIKGVLRDSMREVGADNKRREGQDLVSIFGPDALNASDHAGALVVGDARLLALPVRSFKGTFAWATSPLLLTLALRDLEGATKFDLTAPARLDGAKCRVTRGSLNLITVGGQDKVFFEDLDLKAEQAKDDNDPLEKWAKALAGLVSPEAPEVFSKRLVLVDDETMAFLWETCTQVDTRNRMDPDSHTVADGALWTEESLPPESLLLGRLAAEPTRISKKDKDPDQGERVHLSAEAVLDRVLLVSAPRSLQFGGKATVGRGRCRITALS